MTDEPTELERAAMLLVDVWDDIGDDDSDDGRLWHAVLCVRAALMHAGYRRDWCRFEPEAGA